MAALSLSRVVFLIFIIDSLVLGSSSFVLDQLFATIVGVFLHGKKQIRVRACRGLPYGYLSELNQFEFASPW